MASILQREGIVNGKDMENDIKDSVKFYPCFDLGATTERLGFTYGFQEDRDRFMYVADPKRYQNMWKGFEP